jgi:hypothetical protein
VGEGFLGQEAVDLVAEPHPMPPSHSQLMLTLISES